MAREWEGENRRGETGKAYPSTAFPSHLLLIRMVLSLSEIDDEMNTDEEIDELADDNSETSDDSMGVDLTSEDSDTAALESESDRSAENDENVPTATRRLGALLHEPLGECAYCRLPLGPTTGVDSRVFRCEECDSLQCEACCHTIHICKPGHVLHVSIQYPTQTLLLTYCKEWRENETDWIKTNTKHATLDLKYPTLCGSCDALIAAAGIKMPKGVVQCDPGGSRGLLI